MMDIPPYTNHHLRTLSRMNLDTITPDTFFLPLFSPPPHFCEHTIAPLLPVVSNQPMCYTLQQTVYPLKPFQERMLHEERLYRGCEASRRLVDRLD